MTQTPAQYDVIAIGNAIVDVIAREDDAFLATHALTKGAMQLLDAETAEFLYDAMGSAVEISGGSAANTLAGMAAFGKSCAFIGQVRDDQLGQVFAHDIRALGIAFDTPVRTQEPPTARCLIMVTPDAQRTMNTYLGASQFLPALALDKTTIQAAKILYLEGYLWDPEEPRAAMRTAIGYAKEAGRKVAFTLSADFVIARHRADFLALIEEGLIDILFSNEDEIRALTELESLEAAIAAIAPKVPVLVCTCGAEGAIAIVDGVRSETTAAPVAQIVDTTGAGDLFASGFLTGYVDGLSVEDSLKLGAIAAAEVISHYGARPEADLKLLRAQQL
ncbi:adenosine kinase [Sphingobium sp. SCG-1]|uniref:adenosine kinase n=1 Tax=Sphingobium sp. SCG-1 TaxID=2072936 RepID=UPI001CB8FD8D|nr:adenosine kinase [Sphingobium sp. SCG-1]